MDRDVFFLSLHVKEVTILHFECSWLACAFFCFLMMLFAGFCAEKAQSLPRAKDDDEKDITRSDVAIMLYVSMFGCFWEMLHCLRFAGWI